ncbi:MAG: hypothetical protein WKF97_03220 [Chitinophagaceae bacterium]
MNKLVLSIFLGTFFSSGQNADAQVSEYKIKHVITVEKPVSPLLYGSFIELGFGRYDNLWAEMLYNRSFEEDSAFTTDWVQFTKPQKEMEDWWHSGYEQQPWYLSKSMDDSLSNYDKNRSYWPACHSKTNINIINKSKTDPVYFAQDGMVIRKGMSYHFSGYFNNGNGFGAEKYSKDQVTIIVGLYKEMDLSQPIVEKTLLINTSSFDKYELELPASDYEGRATFAIKIPANKHIGVDLVSLMPADNIKGWRKDVINTTKTSLGVSYMRFPGGCYASFYDWRDGIGDPFYRSVDLVSFWGSPVINDIGTLEFVEFCRELNAEPQICVPLMFKSIENTLEWLSFCNEPNNKLRAKYGHPEPLNVKYWELENEMYRKMDAITYAGKCAEFSKAMKEIDPTIKTIMGDYWIYNSKLKEMLEIAGPYIDIVNNRGGGIAEQAADIAIIREYNKKNNRSIQICHSEFRAPLERSTKGVDGLNRVESVNNESLQNMSVRWAFGMSVLDQFIHFQNFGGDYAYLNFTSLNDTWGENLINISKEGVYLSSSGKALELLNKLQIAYPVEISDKEKDRDIVLQAAWNKEKTSFTLIALNFSGINKACSFNLSDLNTKFDPIKNHAVVYADNLKDFNSPKEHNKIKSIDDKIKIEKNTFSTKLKPYSANAWVFSVR